MHIEGIMKADLYMDINFYVRHFTPSSSTNSLSTGSCNSAQQFFEDNGVKW